MKSIIQFTTATLFALAIVCLSVTKGISQNAQPIPQIQAAAQGIKGHEIIKTTVNFSDMVAYDAAHPELRANLKSPREVEFNHGDLIDKKYGKTTHAVPVRTSEKSNHREKSNQPASPAPVTTFEGEHDDTGIEPPDVSGAAGPVYIITAHNQDVKIMNKTGTQVATASLPAFWTSIGTQTSDPKVLYDPTADRFIFVCLINYLTTMPLLGVAVTQTNDPTGTWNIFGIAVDSTGGTFLDYPELGYNKNWVAVGGNYFSNTSGGFVGVGLFVVDKADLYNNSGAIYTKFTGTPYFDANNNDMCIVPASIPDTNVNDLFILESYDGTAGKIRQFNISGTPTAPSLSPSFDIQTSFRWSGSGGGNLGAQLNSTINLDLDDDRISGSVMYRNGHLWVAHNAYLPEANPSRCSAHWMELDTMHNIIQDAMIDDSTGANFYTYPAIAVASNGNAVIAYTNMGSNIYATCGYSFRAATDPINTFRANYQYKAGANTYGNANANRWGDYSFACIDPSDDSTFWVVAEYAESTANTWRTWWAEINPVCITPFTPSNIMGPAYVCSSTLTPSWYSVISVAGATSYTWTVPIGNGWTSITSTTDSDR